jgi:lysophospholipase L1-like esterase
MRGFSSDIRYALRTVRHGGISTAVAALSLAVGVGANAAIFSVGYAMLARPLPYARADRLVIQKAMRRREPHVMRSDPQSVALVRRWHALAVCGALVLATSTLSLVHGQTPAKGRWIATWATAVTPRVDAPPPALSPPAAPVPARTPSASDPQTLPNGEPIPTGGQSAAHFHNQTIRQIVHTSVGGSKVRVAVSNTFGTSPLVIGAAQIATRDKDSSIVPQSNRVLRFNGIPAPTIPPGATYRSDPVEMKVPDFTDLVIDLYLPGNTKEMNGPITTHPASWQTEFVSTSGNHAGTTTFPVETTTQYRRADGLVSATSFFLARVEVFTQGPVIGLATLGDSITDGTASGIDKNQRWPDFLARRLAKAGVRVALMNVGIGGNRVLDGGSPSALSRLDRDVLSQPGITHVIFLEGINDIGGAREKPSPSADDLIAAHQQIIDRAHARGLKIFGATLTPFDGANYFAPEGEAKRQALNNWIRTSKAYDAFFDFDAATRDPNNPSKARPEFDPGDHLHLTPAGYQAMANAIDLKLFGASGSRGGAKALAKQ